MEIAYKGKIGRKREKFCIDFIARQQEVFSQISARQNETISCKKGCTYCCAYFVYMTIQEGEAIVYYLYKNRDLMDNFLKKYPVWREKVRMGGDLFIKPKVDYNRYSTGSTGRISTGYELGDLTAYAMQDILCPFLIDGACFIYEVRPFVCAGLVVTTPNEWCNPSSPSHLNGRKVYQTYTQELFPDIPFYYGKLEEQVGSFMPIMVYNILKSGTSGIPKIPGLENLPGDFMNDPEVKSIIQNFKSHTDN
jgi:Fe-S-cluster containining protein